MIILELNLKAFGKFHNKVLSLQPTVNVIEGQNEAGKSTIHAFIGAVLFGIDGESESDNRYRKYKPWLDRGKNFGGAMKFEEAGNQYYLERNFALGQIEFTQIGTGVTYSGEDAEKELRRVLGGLTSIGYSNTVSIVQMKGTTDETIAEELRNNLDNLSRARSTALNFRNAENALKEIRDNLEYKIKEYNEAALDKEMAELETKRLQLQEAIGFGWQAKQSYDYATELKKNAYETYEAKREDLLERSESIDREQNEIRQQQDLWKKTDKSILQLLNKKMVKVQKLKAKGKDPVKAFAPALAIWWLLYFIAIAVVAACTIMYFTYEKRDLYIYIAAGALAVAVTLLIINICRKKAYNKKKGYYRTLLERHSRQEEYERTKKVLDSAKAEVFREMTEEQTGDYIRACEIWESADKNWNNANIYMRGAAQELDAVKVRLEEKIREKSEYEECKKNLQAVAIAWENLYRAGEISVKTFGRELIELAGKYLGIVTEQKYTAIIYSPDGVINLVGNEGNVSVASVSRGTMEQVYLCIRLAAGKLLSPKVTLPFILDDTFAYYDDERTLQSLKLLKNCGHQVILMTCQSREKSMLGKI